MGEQATDTSERSAPASQWLAGTAVETVTPEEPMWMAGLSARDAPSEGTIQDLHAKALALEDDAGDRVVMVSLEILFVPRELRLAVERRCRSEFDLQPSSILITATHTHCGPEFIDWRARVYGVDDEYVDRAVEYADRLEDTVVDLVGRALEDRRPASPSYTHSRCGIASNRRLPTSDGVEFAQNPDGRSDPAVPVLAVEADESLLAIAFGYACHPVTVFENRYCGDWPGYAQEYLEAEYPAATAMFFQGCEGDQQVYPNSDVTYAKQHGRTMANAVQAALEAERRPITGPVRTAFEETELAFEPPPNVTPSKISSNPTTSSNGSAPRCCSKHSTNAASSRGRLPLRSRRSGSAPT
jgi:hypothetical protein